MSITVKSFVSIIVSPLRMRANSIVILLALLTMFLFSDAHAASRREREVTIAAADSRAAAKAAADYVCTGTNDELVVQRAIEDCALTGRNLFLYAGLYRFDAVYDFKDGGPRSAIVIRNMRRAFEMKGEGRYVMGWSKEMNTNGVIFSLSENALPGSGESVDIVRGEWSRQGIMNGSALRLENLAVWAPDSQHNLRALDLRRVMSVEVSNVRLCALGKALLKGLKYPYGDPPAPVIGNIGLTMTDGSNTVPANFVNVCATGFGQGIQVGGEHVIMINCAATFGLYGFTFGNYEYNCAFNHPITLINCCDEQNVNMPLFASCGDNGGKIHGRQEVTMISFNFERVAKHVPGKKLGDLMRETRPGSWRGQIGFTTQPKWNDINAVDLPLWAEDGSGTGFRTVNNAHKLASTSAERRTYYPQYMQQIYDLDLKKLLICVDPAKRRWVDAFGNDCP